ncbi:MAG: CBS domain-containing protein [Xanthomonadales bacterium]|nr:CBS domain-containing protein [Gammaproteobacteria bacterium]MBT8052162.1 CBS domain-containing protein [Gammaproteobacteria bacterium]MBT8056847.1 CBS domain-containing protein [Gammaproteobacteria bacterium]NNJ79497.1 CBS domain-containing protein [Xanthomonadales bacterium]NNL05635.1 CBS domain-containing protein [Xanthomonadales bacterium]
MGEQNVKLLNDEETSQAFMRALLVEVHALERMLEMGLVETGVRRIGAEQEMFLIDKANKPALKALDILDIIDDERFTHELGLFNLEANLSPHRLGADCLSKMEKEVQEIYEKARRSAARFDCDIALVGILPTLTKNNLGLDSMVPTPRYHALNDAICRMRGKDFEFTINGIDQLSVKHDNVMLEACNTSFQVHFQVSPEKFARNYNIAQVVTAPLLAAAVNSPVLLGKRLWHETRIAVFEYSIDTRSNLQQERGLMPRVHFGDRWIEESVTEIFKEDIARFRTVLTTDTEDDPLGMLDQGITPSLNALRLHNGTVYRWNRPCYGVKDNVPHLRIENRVIPSGPTVLDEIANAAFFFGMMTGMIEQDMDVRKLLTFADVKSNFLAAARDGIRAQMNWFNDTHLPAKQLVLEQLLPLAREGLEESGIDRDDIDRYLGVLRDRVTHRRTGARWALESLESMHGHGTADQRLRCVVSSLVEQQATGTPISEWRLADFRPEQDWRDSYQTIGQFMTQDLFTVRHDDIVDFAATIMDWRHVRHVPVEDDDGHLIGLISHRCLLKLFAHGRVGREQEVTVGEIMNTEPRTVEPDTPTVEAIRIMRSERLACLPVTRENKLVGIVTEHDFIKLASRLLEDQLSSED